MYPFKLNSKLGDIVYLVLQLLTLSLFPPVIQLFPVERSTCVSTFHSHFLSFNNHFNCEYINSWKVSIHTVHPSLRNIEPVLCQWTLEGPHNPSLILVRYKVQNMLVLKRLIDWSYSCCRYDYWRLRRDSFRGNFVFVAHGS